MLIECTTTSAASEVMVALHEGKLRPGQEFHIDGPELPDPPIHFTLHVNLFPQVLRRIQGIPGARIVDACGS